MPEPEERPIRPNPPIPAQLWQDVGVVAAARGIRPSEALVEALNEYVEHHWGEVQQVASRRRMTKQAARGVAPV